MLQKHNGFERLNNIDKTDIIDWYTSKHKAQIKQ